MDFIESTPGALVTIVNMRAGRFSPIAIPDCSPVTKDRRSLDADAASGCRERRARTIASRFRQLQGRGLAASGRVV